MAEPEHKCPPCEEGAPAWMTTYGDMVTLILCFFVILYSMSDVSQEKFAKILGAVELAFGEGYNFVTDEDEPPKPKDYFQQIIELSKLRREADGMGYNFGENKRLSFVKEGASIILGDQALFDDFSVVLGANARRHLVAVVRKHQLGPYQNVIIIKGNVAESETDRAIRERYPDGRADFVSDDPALRGRALKVTVRDGRDLSYYRAKAVADFLAYSAELEDRERVELRRIDLRAMDRYNVPDNYLTSSLKSPKEAGGDSERSSGQRVEIIVSEVLVPRRGTGR